MIESPAALVRRSDIGRKHEKKPWAWMLFHIIIIIIYLYRANSYLPPPPPLKSAELLRAT